MVLPRFRILFVISIFIFLFDVSKGWWLAAVVVFVAFVYFIGFNLLVALVWSQSVDESRKKKSARKMGCNMQQINQDEELEDQEN